MTKLSIYDIEGKPKGNVTVETIPDGFEPNNMLIARSLKRQLANARKPYAHTKTRAEVSGGGRKPFKQKGLGRSRQGSTRAIQWTGGGVAFGPRSDRNFNIGMNKKERKTALKHLIWSKIKDGNWLLFADLNFGKPSTKKGKKFIEALNRKGKLLIVLPDDDKYDVVHRSLRNLEQVTIVPPDRLNTFNLLNCDTVLAHEEAFKTIRQTWQV